MCSWFQLDDWVLCRIYKKNSSSQKPISGVNPTIEHSHVSSSSSSSQFDDMLESLPDINDRLFNLPRMNSVRTIQHQDEKLNIQNLTSGNFDWASLAGAASLPELVPGSQYQGHVSNHNIKYNDVYVPSMSMEEEVQSGIRAQQSENQGLFQQNPNGFTQGFANSIDPFSIRYQTNQTPRGGFGFRQ